MYNETLPVSCWKTSFPKILFGAIVIFHPIASSGAFLEQQKHGRRKIAYACFNYYKDNFTLFLLHIKSYFFAFVKKLRDIADASKLANVVLRLNSWESESVSVMEITPKTAKFKSVCSSPCDSSPGENKQQRVGSTTLYCLAFMLSSKWFHAIVDGLHTVLTLSPLQI